MNFDDQRIYRTFEEFEREELRRADGLGTAFDDAFSQMFIEELDMEFKSLKRGADEDDED